VGHFALYWPAKSLYAHPRDPTRMIKRLAHYLLRSPGSAQWQKILGLKKPNVLRCNATDFRPCFVSHYRLYGATLSPIPCDIIAYTVRQNWQFFATDEVILRHTITLSAWQNRAIYAAEWMTQFGGISSSAADHSLISVERYIHFYQRHRLYNPPGRHAYPPKDRQTPGWQGAQNAETATFW